jgi:Flp pilus assembly protein TadG
MYGMDIGPCVDLSMQYRPRLNVCKVTMNVSSTNRPELSRARRRRKPRQGAAAVELALVLPTLFVVVLGTVTASQLMYFRKSLVVAASDGVRLASQRGMTTEDVESRVGAVLASRRIPDATITLTPEFIEQAAPGDVIELQVEASFEGFGRGFASWGASVPVTVSSSILRE